MGYLTDIEDFVRRRMVLEREARLDPLTGVLNARAGRETASRRVERLDGTYTGLLAIFDLDEFKSVNDVYGHQVGDRVLQEFSKVLVTVFRSEDTVYRLGGDEFAVYMESAPRPPARGRVRDGALPTACWASTRSTDISIKASVGIFASPRPHDFGRVLLACRRVPVQEQELWSRPLEPGRGRAGAAVIPRVSGCVFEVAGRPCAR